MKKKDSIFFPLLFFALISGGALWYFYKGLTEGKVHSIAKTQHSTIYTRTEDPGLYWTSVSVLGLVGTASTALLLMAIYGSLFKKN
jgi:hypothetical protein